MDAVTNFVTDDINYWLWQVIPYLLIAAGLYFGVRTFVVQIRHVPSMFRAVTEKPPVPGDDISAFKAFTISAASRVGTGNVTGVAIAISMGGPGAVFWMWMLAILGGATAFVESTLAQLFKTRDSDGNYLGGPAYYISRGLGWKKFAVVFAIAISVTYGLIYNAIQTNSIVTSMSNSFSNDSIGFKSIIGLAVAILTAFIVFGGVKRIANVTQAMVPFMAIAYILVGILVVIINIQEVPSMFATICEHAVGVKEIAGAAVGQAFTKGMQRGLFSNEAGQGSAPNAAATATVTHPAKQGLVQTLGVYFDTLVVCSITAFVILLGPAVNYGDKVEGVHLTQTALAASVGNWGIHFVTFIMFFLAFSSVIGNYYLAQANIQYLTESKKALNVFRVLVLLAVFGGALGSVALVWSLGDTFAGLMVAINLTALIPLGGLAVKMLGNFDDQLADGRDPIFLADMLPEAKNVECWRGDEPELKSPDGEDPHKYVGNYK